MFRLDARLAGKAASAAVAGLILLTPATSFGQYHSGYEQPVFPRERPVYRTPLEVWLSGEGWDEDYSRSDVCINGYRWMTRNVEHADSSAAEDAVPVRC